jgi:hypothetical protein
MDRRAATEPMRTGFLTISAFLLLTLAAAVLAAQQPKAASGGEQAVFYEGKPILQPMALPAEVLKILLDTKQAIQEMDLASDAQRRNPSLLFRAAAVHLSHQDELDLVVIGVPPMAGADTAWFWIVRSVRKNPQVVLFTDGNSLEILDNKTNGSRDIRCIWSSSAETNYTIFHFDGESYRVWKNKWTESRE